MSQPHQYVPYMEQVLSYKGENLNTRNLNDVFRIRGPHSSNSDPLKFLKIEKLKTKQEKFEAYWEASREEYKNYQEPYLEAL